MDKFFCISYMSFIYILNCVIFDSKLKFLKEEVALKRKMLRSPLNIKYYI